MNGRMIQTIAKDQDIRRSQILLFCDKSFCLFLPIILPNLQFIDLTLGIGLPVGIDRGERPFTSCVTRDWAGLLRIWADAQGLATLAMEK